MFRIYPGNIISSNLEQYEGLQFKISKDHKFIDVCDDILYIKYDDSDVTIDLITERIDSDSRFNIEDVMTHRKTTIIPDNLPRYNNIKYLSDKSQSHFVSIIRNHNTLLPRAMKLKSGFNLKWKEKNYYDIYSRLFISTANSSKYMIDLKDGEYYIITYMDELIFFRSSSEAVLFNLQTEEFSNITFDEGGVYFSYYFYLYDNDLYFVGVSENSVNVLKYDRARRHFTTVLEIVDNVSNKAAFAGSSDTNYFISYKHRGQIGYYSIDRVTGDMKLLIKHADKVIYDNGYLIFVRIDNTKGSKTDHMTVFKI